jgi:hypothetical protein
MRGCTGHSQPVADRGHDRARRHLGRKRFARRASDARSDEPQEHGVLPAALLLSTGLGPKRESETVDLPGSIGPLWNASSRGFSVRSCDPFRVKGALSISGRAGALARPMVGDHHGESG